MTVVIPEELLAPLRDGLFFDLYVQVEEASALIDPRKRGNPSRRPPRSRSMRASTASFDGCRRSGAWRSSAMSTSQTF
jgi:hypothetical protein